MSHPYVATAYFAYSAHLMSKIASVLGKAQDAEEYAVLHKHIGDAYVAAFVGDDGRMKPDTQASYVRALMFGLLPERLRPLAAQRLVELIGRARTHLATGFLSTPFLLPVLTDNGYADVAYTLLKQATPPSWLYAVKKGATTIWENWNGIDQQGNAHGSLNHYSYGAVGNWLYQVVAGLEIGTSGYKHIQFQPQPGGELTEAQASYESLYGKIASGWRIEDGQFALTVTVPANTTATVAIPTRPGSQVTEGGRTLESVEGIIGVKQEQKATLIEVGSGTYTFTVLSTDKIELE